MKVVTSLLHSLSRDYLVFSSFFGGVFVYISQVVWEYLLYWLFGKQKWLSCNFINFMSDVFCLAKQIHKKKKKKSFYHSIIIHCKPMVVYGDLELHPDEVLSRKVNLCLNWKIKHCAAYGILSSALLWNQHISGLVFHGSLEKWW